MRQADLEMLVNRCAQECPMNEKASLLDGNSVVAEPKPFQQIAFSYGLALVALNWSDISLARKYNVIDFAGALPTAPPQEAGELVLLVQPILAEAQRNLAAP